VFYRFSALARVNGIGGNMKKLFIIILLVCFIGCAYVPPEICDQLERQDIALQAYVDNTVPNPNIVDEDKLKVIQIGQYLKISSTLLLKWSKDNGKEKN